MDNLLQISNLKTYYILEKGMVKAIDGVDLNLKKGEVLGIAGESGCGKSTLGLSILKLVPKPGKIMEGKIIFQGIDLLKIHEKDMRNIRGAGISMIFQNPASSLNPVFTIGSQLGEAIELHQYPNKNLLNGFFKRGKNQNEVKKKMIEALKAVKIPDPLNRLQNYPHEFSGGMKQRAMIAIAVSCQPKLIIADEPTTNLDVTVQAQILNLLKEIKSEFNSSIIFISHDLGVLSQICDRIAIMYAGKIVEYSIPSTLIKTPKHPYTKALVNSIPRLGVERLDTISGQPPNLLDPPTGCRFHPRCEYKISGLCEKKEPELIQYSDQDAVSCFLFQKEINGKSVDL
jgi:oligopeptide/dipeptide ABC transporter ATP-binding protein